MNYIKQLNAFYKLIKVNSVSSNAQCLYCYLLAVNNELSWAETFTQSNFVVCGATQLSRQSLDRARNELKTKNLIDYEKGRSNQAGTYKIIPLYDETLTVDFDTQRGADCQFCYTDETHNDTQSGHTITTLNKNKLENDSLYFNLIKKAREKKDEYNGPAFGKVVYAYNWAKQQPEFGELSFEQQNKFFAEV